MKMSFKKLSMMVMLGFILNPTATQANKKHKDKPAEQVYTTQVKVINLGANQYIGQFNDPNYIQQNPIDKENHYNFSSDHGYYLMVYHKANTDCAPAYMGPSTCPAYHTPSQSVRRAGSEFKKDGTGIWDVSNNSIS
ncbi:hypothetical protein [Candidatus Chromulinivorax destructor]|uniref:Uncharacterized protein n=1 Tax=Candidatus Chromulinivorax destructor TaxID=2066483 RepID=A0A345ZB81_9BACT|nr:hypothetical protein [Candidatus Chromulinivorax destructor]AXK60548.1 hypothetical protein C0J27_02195 [Candidatus Chromulinivorax destructor]